MNRRLGGLQSRYDRCEKDKLSRLCPESNPDSSAVQTVAYLIYRLNYPCSQWSAVERQKMGRPRI
jgi:hypothetical protein